MSDDTTIQFYAEISTPESIRLTYAPEGRCLGCNAKLSRYRTMTFGEWDKWCAPCQEKGTFELQCENCWETFPSYGTRVICAKCIVPAQREKRREETIQLAEQVIDLIYRYNWSLEKVVDKFEYRSVIELKRTMERFAQLVQESDEY